MRRRRTRLWRGEFENFLWWSAGAVERGGLEHRNTPKRYQRFKSSLHRQFSEFGFWAISASPSLPTAIFSAGFSFFSLSHPPDAEKTKELPFFFTISKYFGNIILWL